MTICPNICGDKVGTASGKRDSDDDMLHEQFNHRLSLAGWLSKRTTVHSHGLIVSCSIGVSTPSRSYAGPDHQISHGLWYGKSTFPKRNLQNAPGPQSVSILDLPFHAARCVSHEAISRLLEFSPFCRNMPKCLRLRESFLNRCSRKTTALNFHANLWPACCPRLL
jgi:hypothetical protein